MSAITARPNVLFGTGGFPTAEISIHISRVSTITVLDSVVYADLQKMKLLGSKSGALYMPNNIQPREYSKGGGTDGF
jgi:hypothetical protein